MNRWNIPDWLERETRARDRVCVYCGVTFDASNRKTTATWEHIVNDARIVTRANIALCCVSCNASKGAKALSDWLESAYCKARGITADSVAPMVRDALASPQTNADDD